MTPIQASNIMNDQPANSYLIRWSRTNPESFTVTYTVMDNNNIKKVSHQRMDETIFTSLSEFLLKRFNGMKKVNLKLKEIALNNKRSLTDYASNTTELYG